MQLQQKKDNKYSNFEQYTMILIASTATESCLGGSFTQPALLK
jgi:hypothetical protein